MVAKLPGNNLVMGQMKILKPEELLGKSEDEKKGKRWWILDWDRRIVGPELETVRKEVRVEEFNKAVDVMYAGSAVFTWSPSSSLLVSAFNCVISEKVKGSEMMIW
ncbi:unnamed protein product [Linum trigynum]|uniref:Uncharacterized protein n=1 Tax=Linum trigynum TaxID=586398 RepID=A0AAV2CUI9_9ROSI